MIKGQAKAEQFYTRSGSESTKGSRKGFGLLGGGEDVLAHLAPEEKRASLVQKFKALQIELVEVKKGRDKRRLQQIISEITTTQEAISAIRPKRVSSDPQAIANLFIDVCREMMTKPQFNAIMDEANRRQRAAKDAA